jgi:predicted O-linked N-acetylglucosamine transferase (SPINDLY family)
MKVNTSKLAQEIKTYLPVDSGAIRYWSDRYHKERNPLFHPYVEIAQLLTNSAMHERATEFYQRYLNKKLDKTVHSLYLQNLVLSSTATNQSLMDAHLIWAKHYGNLNVPKKNIKVEATKPLRRIRVGYICHFFDNSISRNVFLPFLKLHDKNIFEVYCYDDGTRPDEYMQYVEKWHDIRCMTDNELADLIVADGIDILQEMNGFCYVNRFGALATKPAPIQINWYNHTATTGLPYIDYAMSDSVSIHDTDLPYYVERVYRHPHFIAAVSFDTERFGENIEKNPPVVKNGYITFGYFGSSHKLTLDGIKAWAKILKSVENSKLILKSATYSHELYLTIFRRHFANEGIDVNRIVFDGWTDQVATLKKYSEIDIMLDNIPVNGGSTLFETLIQGVPAVTLKGNRWAARSGASVLTTLGHPELIANTVDEYVDIAVDLANNIPKITDYRNSLRKEMLNSPLTNIEKFYQNFETAYLAMWEDYHQKMCASQ